MLLVTHLTLGFRRLRTIDVYRHDPLVRRFLGLTELPSVSTIARTMEGVGQDELARLGLGIERLTLERLQMADRGFNDMGDLSPDHFSPAGCGLMLDI